MKKYILVAVLVIVLLIFIKIPASNQSLYSGKFENISLQASSEKISQLLDENTVEYIPFTYSGLASKKCKLRKIDGTNKMEFIEGQDTYILYKLNRDNLYRSICLDVAEKHNIKVSKRFLRTIRINEVNLGNYIFEEQNKSDENGILIQYGETEYSYRFKMFMDYKQLDTIADVYKFSKAIALSNIFHREITLGTMLLYNTVEKTYEPYLQMEGISNSLYDDFSTSYYAFTVQNAIKYFEHETVLTDVINNIIPRYKLSKEFKDEIVSGLDFNVSSSAYGLYINEVMPANKSANEDPKGDKPDWIELYNGSGNNINLSGYKLRDNESDIEWTFPDVNLMANNYLMLWGSGKDQDDMHDLHTNFKLRSGYGNLELLDNEGNVLDFCTYEDVPDDKTFGRVRADIVKKHLENPTFANVNTPETGRIIEELKMPVYSAEAGFYDNEFYLELSAEDPEALIFYTTDGSGPSVNSTLYTKPILIKNVNDEPMKYANHVYSLINDYIPPNSAVPKCNVIRAVAVKDGIASRINTKTYFVGETKIDKSLTVVSLAVNPDEFFSEEKGIYAVGDEGWKWKNENPEATYDEIYSAPANYKKRGAEYEIPSSLEIINNNENKYSQTNVGIKIKGVSSRLFNKKSLTIKTKKKYGDKIINYNIFGQEQHDTLVLRNSGQDLYELLFRDALVHQLAKEIDIDYQDYEPAILFINGEYWGIYNIRRTYDEQYFRTLYNLDFESICIYECTDDLYFYSDGNPKLVDKYKVILDIINNHNVCSDTVYQNIDKLLDIENFTKYGILQMLCGNTDWPSHNVKIYWGEDLKIRFLLYDSDKASFMNRDIINRPTVKDTESQYYLILNFLLSNKNYKQYYNEQEQIIKNVLNDDHIIRIVASCYKKIDKEVKNDILRWNNMSSWQKWIDNVDKLITIINE